MTSTWTSTSLPYLKPAERGAPDAWTQEAPGRGIQRLLAVGEWPAPRDVRLALALQDEEPVIVRRRLMLLDDEPVELTDSYYPRRVAAGTQLAEAKRIKGGAPTLLAELGYRTRRVVEDVAAREATPEEAAELEIPPGSPVLELFRTSYSEAEDPVEVSIMVMKGPRRIRYETKVD